MQKSHHDEIFLRAAYKGFTAGCAHSLFARQSSLSLWLQFHAATSASPLLPYSKSRGFSPLGAGLLLVAALLLARWLWGLLRIVQWGPRGKRKGRWVRDRGLGGKMVSFACSRPGAWRTGHLVHCCIPVFVRHLERAIASAVGTQYALIYSRRANVHAISHIAIQERGW